jgi:hypothetical protein
LVYYPGRIFVDSIIAKKRLEERRDDDHSAVRGGLSHGIFAPAILMAVAGVGDLFVSFNADMQIY